MRTLGVSLFSVVGVGLAMGAVGCGSDGLGTSTDGGATDSGADTATADGGSGADAAPPVDAGPDAVVIVDSGIVDLKTGPVHQLVLKTDGTVWAHGSDNYGQLGQGVTHAQPVPALTKVPGLPAAGAIAVANATSFAMDPSGAVWAWGNNSVYTDANASVFGDGANVAKSSAKATGFTNCVELANGDSFSVAVKKDGTVWTWGYDFAGRLGPGASGSRLSPGQVTGLSGVTHVATGADFAFAIQADKTIFAWGRNNQGQLGTGDRSQGYLPGVPGPVSGINDAIAVVASSSGGDLSASGAHAFALRSDGSVWAWGDAVALGVDVSPATYTATPKKIPGLSNVTALAAGDLHVLALTSDGSVWAWGSNVSGEIGDGTTNDALVPKKVPGLSGVVRIFAGMRTSFAIKADGTIWGWGDNLYGQLGLAPGGTRSNPTQGTF